MKFSAWVLAAAMALATLGASDAEAARRLGGGGSIGKQSGNVTQREAAKPTPTTPANATQNTPNTAAAAPATAAAGQAAKRPWGAMLGGLAAGLGLAWLASSLGLGEAFGQFLLIALLVLAVMVVVGMVMRARGRKAAGMARSPYAFEGAGASAPANYKPENVGNDASARPWERATSPMPLQGGRQRVAIGSAIGSAGADVLSGAQGWGIPGGFDIDGFLRASKANFVTMQAAWDRSDMATLRSMMTDEMLGEIKAQLSDRAAHTGGSDNHTDVVMLDAQLLGIEDLGDGYLASVEFSGMIREEPSAGPSPFREVWNMSKPKDGSSGWLVAGVQALQ